MAVDDETRALIEELADEFFAALVDDQTIRFWEGGIVRSAPTGAPPEYITVEIEGIYDENVMWRGIPPTPAVGDEVLVWENPITHRREVLGASGTGGTTGGSWCQKITVAICNGDFTLLSAAITWINALPAGQVPSASRLYAINILGGTFTEAADVTIPQYVHVGGEAEGTVLDMGDATLYLAADSSLESIIVKSTGVDNMHVVGIIGNNAVMREVRAVVVA